MKQKISLLIPSIVTALVCWTNSLPAQNTNAPSPAIKPTRLPAVVVTDTPPSASRPGWLDEEQFVGPYAQPEWTTERRFPGTRVYLQQLPWATGAEQWVRFRHLRDGTDETRFQEEFELGLPHRFQVDLYETWAVDQDRRADQDEVSAEVRYALADWGKIPLNPTLYLEYAKHDHDPNTIEGKLLLGTDLAPRWHWGLNLACEQELSGLKNTELAVSQGISYSLVDERLGTGVEMEYSHEKASGTPAENNLMLGPSFQWRPISRCHVDLAPLFGCMHQSMRLEAFLVVGIDLGTVKQGEHYTPASLRSQ